jgi:hypothetical protein
MADSERDRFPNGREIENETLDRAFARDACGMLINFGLVAGAIDFDLGVQACSSGSAGRRPMPQGRAARGRSSRRVEPRFRSTRAFSRAAPVGLGAEFDDEIGAEVPEFFKRGAIKALNAGVRCPCGVGRAPGAARQHKSTGSISSNSGPFCLRPFFELAGYFHGPAVNNLAA